jgi:hypothetical protein
MFTATLNIEGQEIKNFSSNTLEELFYPSFFMSDKFTYIQYRNDGTVITTVKNFDDPLETFWESYD